MKYINTKNGAIIETECHIGGSNWQPLGAAEPVSSKELKAPKEPTAPEELPEYDDDDDSDLEETAPAQPKTKGKKR